MSWFVYLPCKTGTKRYQTAMLDTSHTAACASAHACKPCSRHTHLHRHYTAGVESVNELNVLRASQKTDNFSLGVESQDVVGNAACPPTIRLVLVAEQFQAAFPSAVVKLAVRKNPKHGTFPCGANKALQKRIGVSAWLYHRWVLACTVYGACLSGLARRAR